MTIIYNPASRVETHRNSLKFEENETPKMQNIAWRIVFYRLWVLG